jgi:hypothetical protein
MANIFTSIIIFTTLAGFFSFGKAWPVRNKGAGTPVTIDGPYVLYKSDSIIAHYIDSAEGKKMLRHISKMYSEKDQINLTVNTDEPGKTFQVKLKSKLAIEKHTYNKPKKILVLSDIEGQFGAMRKLLQGNKIIDESLNWIYGDGHLVLTGDFVDRGEMVTEVLWLIYALEAQAEAAGGKIHFILGNHEIMNMSGDLHYVHPRYMAHTELMNLPYISLFGPGTELGRWLATKNVSEKIGNMLFAHGGYSPYMNIVQMNLRQVNDTSRRYYTDTSYNYPSVYSDLMYSEHGPFWYRGYYTGKQKATMAQVDSTLDFYDCRHIITGHTMVSKEIVSLFNGKVLNTDVPHAQGFSEALLIEGTRMYRVNIAGDKKEISSK